MPSCFFFDKIQSKWKYLPITKCEILFVKAKKREKSIDLQQ